MQLKVHSIILYNCITPGFASHHNTSIKYLLKNKSSSKVPHDHDDAYILVVRGQLLKEKLLFCSFKLFTNFLEQ